MIALHTDSLHQYGLNRIFKFAEEAGYDGIEIGVVKSNFDTQNAAYIKELSTQYKLPVLALHTPPKSSRKTVEHVVEMADYLKCPTVVVTPPEFFDFKYANWLRKKAEHLRKKKKLQIALTNSPGKTFLGFLPKHAMGNIGDLKKFGMVSLDCASTFSKKWDLIRVYDYLKKMVVHVHLSNVCRHKEYCLPSKEGVLPLESFLQKLYKNKYKGVLSLRVRPTELKAGEDEEVIKSLKKVKDFVDKFFK